MKLKIEKEKHSENEFLNFEELCKKALQNSKV